MKKSAKSKSATAAKKTPAKKSAASKAKIVKPKKATLKAPQKKACAKEEKEKCSCKNISEKEEFCFEKIISEVFGQLSDTERLADLLKDFFFTELLKRGFEEAVANALANRLIVRIDNFEANIEIDEKE